MSDRKRVGVERIPRRYKHTPTKISGIDRAEKVRIRGSFLGEISPNQSNKISFQLPNRRDLPFIDMSSIELVGEVWVNATSDNQADTFTTMQPSIGGAYDGINLILARMQTFVGSSILDESLNQKLLSSLQIGLKTNTIWRLTQQPYENAGKWQAGDTAPSWRSFRMRLSYKNEELYGSTSEELLSQDFLIPAGIAPKMQVDMFFSPPQEVVTVTSTTVGTVTCEYKLRNLELDTLYIDSRPLRDQLGGPNPWSITWTSHLYQEQLLQAGSIGKISVNIPSAFQQASHIMMVFQRPADDTNPKIQNRVINCSTEVSEVQQCNVRVNGINRYTEPVNQNDLYREVIRIHPSAEFSDFYNTSYATLTSTSNYIILLVGKDYPDVSLLSGVNSARATGSIVTEVQFKNALTSATAVRSFLTYARNLSIDSRGNAVITF